MIEQYNVKEREKYGKNYLKINKTNYNYVKTLHANLFHMDLNTKHKYLINSVVHV